MSEQFIAYRQQRLDRHQNAATSVISTVGDVVMIGASLRESPPDE